MVQAAVHLCHLRCGTAQGGTGAEQDVVLVQLEGASRELQQAGGKGEKKCAARGRSGGGH